MQLLCGGRGKNGSAKPVLHREINVVLITVILKHSKSEPRRLLVIVLPSVNGCATYTKLFCEGLLA